MPGRRVRRSLVKGGRCQVCSRRRASSFHMRRMMRLARCRLCARRAPRRVLPSVILRFEVGPGVGVKALLSDARDVEDAVDPSVAAEVQSVPHRCAATPRRSTTQLRRRRTNGRTSTPWRTGTDHQPPRSMSLPRSDRCPIPGAAWCRGHRATGRGRARADGSRRRSGGPPRRATSTTTVGMRRPTWRPRRGRCRVWRGGPGGTRSCLANQSRQVSTTGDFEPSDAPDDTFEEVDEDQETLGRLRAAGLPVRQPPVTLAAPTPGLRQLLDEAAAVASPGLRQLVANSVAAGTRSVYEKDWFDFEVFCRAHDYGDPLDATALVVGELTTTTPKIRGRRTRLARAPLLWSAAVRPRADRMPTPPRLPNDVCMDHSDAERLARSSTDP
jgi:hypothetical protein